MPRPLDYETPQQLYLSRRMIIALVITISFLVGGAAWNIWRWYYPTPSPLAAAIANADRYFKQSEQVVNDPTLSNIAKATQLHALVQSAIASKIIRTDGVLIPNSAELELAVLMEDPSVRSALGQALCDQYLDELRQAYNSQLLEQGIDIRRRQMNRTTRPATRAN